MTNAAPTSSVLFDPIRIGPFELPGRVFKSATSETRADDNGFVTEQLLHYYEPLAAAKTPMIITGNFFVNRQGCSTHNEGGIDDDAKIPGLRELGQVAHKHGSALVVQLLHAGRQVIDLAPGVRHAGDPSGVREPFLGTKARPLTRDDIAELVRDFAAAAERAAEAELDGIQLHIAHGYLLSEFLTPHTNRRTDEYGGSLDNRMRILVEILRAIRERVGDEIMILAKINGTDMLPGRRGVTTADQVRVAKVLQDEGLHAIEISRSHYESGPAAVAGTFNGFLDAQITEGAGQDLDPVRKAGVRLAGPLIERALNRMFPFEEGFNLPQAEQFTRALDIPVITVGGFHTREGMENAITSGRTDAVSVARAMIADPFLYRHLRYPDDTASQCTYTNKCIARVGGRALDCFTHSS